MGNENQNFFTNDNYDKYSKITSIQSALENCVNNLDPTGSHTQYQSALNRAWEKITGPSTIQHTIALFHRGSTIVVWVDSAGWAQQMRLLEISYIEKLQIELNDPSIKKMRFVTKRRNHK